MTDRALPNWPRLMGSDLAAPYVGISESNFLAGVEKGDWPKPVRYGRRVLWDRLDLDAAVDRMAGREAPAEDGRDWMEAL